MEQDRNRGGEERPCRTDRPSTNVDGDQPELAEQRNDEPPLRPQIYVESVHDYNFGIQHGVWLDADQAPETLYTAIEQMLATSLVARELGLEADEWAIRDYRDFGGLQPDRFETLAVVSRVAGGLAAHGEAYAHWAAFVGVDQAGELERFAQAYVGRWDSMTAFVEHVLDDLGAETYIANAPDGYRRYLRLDLDALARDLRAQLHIAESGDGIYVFDPRQ